MKHLQPVILHVTRKSFLEDEVSIIHSGKAYLSRLEDGFQLVYHESSFENSKVELEAKSGVVTCVRTADVMTECTWNAKMPTQIISKTSLGVHEFDVTTDVCQIEDNHIVIDYQLGINNQVFDRIIMMWDIKEVHHESN